jgi:hypothetical protein
VAYLWRPTDNNRRFAMSDEVSRDVCLLGIHTLIIRNRSPKTTKASK